MFVLQNGIEYFDRACENTQALEKDFKRYSLDPFSSLFFDNNDEENNIEEDNESEIYRLKEKVKILHNEIISLHNQKRKSIMHNEEKITAIHTTLIGPQ